MTPMDFWAVLACTVLAVVGFVIITAGDDGEW